METKFLLELYYLERFVMKLTNHFLFDFVFFLKIWNSYLLIAFETYRVDWQLKFLQMIWCSLSTWKVLLTKTNLYKHIINSWFIVYEFCDFSSLSSLQIFFRNLNRCSFMWSAVSLVDFSTTYILYNRNIII